MWVLLFKDQIGSIHMLDAIQSSGTTSQWLVSCHIYLSTYLSIFKYMTIFDADGIYLLLVSVGISF